MKKAFKLLLYLWIFLAFFNVFYNLIKMVPEYNEWGSLSDNQKRHKIFGDFYDFLVMVMNHTNSRDQVLIYSEDGDKYQTFFQSMYNLYPRNITTSVDRKEFTSLANSKKFPYIAAFNSPIEAEDYNKIASYSAKTTNYGSLYKLK